MKRSNTARRFTLVCAAVIALSLALPFGVFAGWDALLFGGAHPRAQAGDAAALGQEGRGNSTACLLYQCAHLLKVEVLPDAASRREGWTDRPMDYAEEAEAREALLALAQGLQADGLLSAAQAQNIAGALQSPENAGLLLRCTAPGGVDCYLLDETAAWNTDSASLAAAFTPEGALVGFRFQDGSPETRSHGEAALQSCLARIGVAEFADWQYLDQAAAYGGIAAYSPSAQVYVSVNGSGGLRISTASLTPEEFAQIG